MNPVNPVLFYGIGNPGRRDDGLGIAFVSSIDSLNLPEIDIEENYQLNAEDALTIKDRKMVVFVDAAVNINEPYQFTLIQPSLNIEFTTHAMQPQSVLALCEQLYNSRPQCYTLAIRGNDWGAGEGISEPAGQNLRMALQFTRKLLGGKIPIESCRQ